MLDKVKLLLSKWSVALFGLLGITVLVYVREPFLDLDNALFGSAADGFGLSRVPGASEFLIVNLDRMLH